MQWKVLDISFTPTVSATIGTHVNTVKAAGSIVGASLRGRPRRSSAQFRGVHGGTPYTLIIPPYPSAKA
jgi:hypothetical protein